MVFEYHRSTSIKFSVKTRHNTFLKEKFELVRMKISYRATVLKPSISIEQFFFNKMKYLCFEVRNYVLKLLNFEASFHIGKEI